MKPPGRLAWIGTGVLMAVCPGCMIIPTGGYKSDNIPTRQNVSARDAKRIVPAATTRQDVLLMLGEPDASFRGDSRFVYLWADVAAILVAGAGYSGGAWEVPAGHVLEIEFRPDGVVSSCRVQNPGLNDVFRPRTIGGISYARPRWR